MKNIYFLCLFFIIIFFLVITSFFSSENVLAKPSNIPEITSFSESPSQSNSLKLVWDSKGADTIEVLNITTKKPYKFGGATGYTFQGLVNGKSYEVIIRACDRVNNLYDCTNWSPVSSATAKELNNSNNNNNNTNYTASSFSLSPTSFTYDGAAKRPKVTVKNSSGTVLKEGTDYKVEYKNNVNVGTGTCLVTGLGNYNFSKTLAFKINPAGIKSVTLSSSNYTYNGKVKTPSVTVMNNKSSKLVNGRDYSVIYQSGRVKIGTYRVRVIGKGNYKFDKSSYFKINPKGTTLSKKDKTDDSITLSIKKVSGVKYQIGYKKSSSKNYTYKKTEKTTYKISDLKQNTNYNLIVRTYKKVGKVTYYSDFSSVKTIKTNETPTGGELIAQTAEKLAWPKGTPKSKYHVTNVTHIKKWSNLHKLGKGRPTQEFMDAIDKVYPTHWSWGAKPRVGASCDVFVGTVVRYSGYDKNMPRGLDDQTVHLRNSSKWKRVSSKKRGDIMRCTGHIQIYLGDGLVAEGNYNGQNYGHIGKNGYSGCALYRAK